MSENKKRIKKQASGPCETCACLVYDDDFEDYVCIADMDEDEMFRFLSSSNGSCPFYRLLDDYGMVAHQN